MMSLPSLFWIVPSLAIAALGCGRASKPAAAAPASPPASLTWQLLEEIADGKRATLPVRTGHGVFVLTEASCAGGHPPCVPKRLCGAAAEAEARAAIQRMVQKNRTRPDPDMAGECGALPAALGASATCTMPGMAEYDAAYELYVVRTEVGLAIAGMTSTEVGHRDVGVFAEAEREVARPSGTCP